MKSALPLLMALTYGCDPPAPSPSFILVSLDTLRPDHLGAYGDPRGLSPNLDHFASEAVVFDQAYAQANETLFSHAALFTGRYASELNPLTYTFRMPKKAETLAEVLKIYGYRTAAMVGGGHLHPFFGLDEGFDTYQDVQEWGCLYHSVPAALRWLDANTDPSPFFLLVHGYDAHHRYLKPTPFGYAFADPSYQGIAETIVLSTLGTTSVFRDLVFTSKELDSLLDFHALRPLGPESGDRIEELGRRAPDRSELTPEDHQHIRDIYAGAVAYADTFFGIFMAALEQRELLDKAWIVVISDHGETLGENGFYNHRFSLTDADTRVVLMIRPPGGASHPHHEPSLVGLIDVMPTILEEAGAVPPADLEGLSLRSFLRGAAPPSRDAIFTESAFRMASVRTIDHRAIFSGSSADSPIMADLVEMASPRGKAWEYLPPADEATEADLRRRFAEWRRTLQPPMEMGGPVDPALIEALRERGYWGLQ